MTRGRLFRLNVFSRFLSITALLVCGASSSVQAWEHIGVGGGGYFSNVVIDPDNKNKIFVGTDVTGLFRTTNAGTSWTALTNGLGSYYVGEILLAKPFGESNIKTLFVTTKPSSASVGGGGVYRSTNDGVSFEKVLSSGNGTPPADRAFWALAVDPIDSDIIYAGEGFFKYGDSPVVYSTANIWRSTDLGENWSQFGFASTCAIHSIVPSKDDTQPSHPGADILYVSGSRLEGAAGWVGVKKGVWNQTANKWIWSDINGSDGYGGIGLPHRLTRDLQATFDEEVLSRLYVVLDTQWDEEVGESSVYDYESGYGSGVWYTTNEGSTWNPTSAPVPCDGFILDSNPPKNMRNLEVSEDGQEIYVVLSEGNISHWGAWRGTEGNCQGGWGQWELLSDAYIDDEDYNVELTYEPLISACEGLDIHEQSGDIVFSSSWHVWRCPDGDCVAGEEEFTWDALNTTTVPGTPLTWTTTGMDEMQAFEISVDPTSENLQNWYLGVGDQGLFRSENGGDSWSLCPAPGPYGNYHNLQNCWKIFPVKVATGDPDLYHWIAVFGEYVAANMDVWVWTDTTAPPDDEDHWVKIGFPDPGPHVINDVMVVDEGAQAKMVVSAEQGIYRAQLSGGAWPEDLTEWMNRPGPDVWDSRVADEVVVEPPSLTPDRRYVAAFQRLDPQHPGGIFYANSFGGDWEAADPGEIDEDCWESMYSLEWSKANAQEVFAGSGNPRGCLLKSTNRGEDWLLVDEPSGSLNAGCLNIVDLVQTESDQLYAAFRSQRTGACLEDNFGGVWEWDDGWTSFNQNLDAGHMTFLKEDNTTDGRLFCGTMGNGAYIFEASARGTNPPSIALAKVEQAQPSLHGVQSSNRPGSAAPSVQFAVGAQVPVTVSIYGTTGRLVRLLMKERVYAEGVHMVSWDGLDDSGHRAPSGVYYARVSTPIESETVKLLMVR